MKVDSLAEHRLIQILHDRTQRTDWIQKTHPTANLAAAIERSALLMRRVKEEPTETRR